MPLEGIIDPSHEERMLSEPGRFPRWMPVEEVLQRALTSEPKWSPWPYELVAAALREHHDTNDPESDTVSVTMLSGDCPRSKVLQKLEPYIDSLDEMFPAVRGTLLHRTLEREVRPNALAECRFAVTLDRPGLGKVQFRGSPDLVTQDAIFDYKWTENPPKYQYPYKNHTRQLQYLRWLVNHAEAWRVSGEKWGSHASQGLPPGWPHPQHVKFERLVAVYLGPKGPKPLTVEHSIDAVTPGGKAIRKKVPYVALDGEVEEELLPRLDTMVRALRGFPEFPVGAEKVWGGEPGWKCPGPPLCRLPNCLAKRYPNLMWESPRV